MLPQCSKEAVFGILLGKKNRKELEWDLLIKIRSHYSSLNTTPYNNKSIKFEDRDILGENKRGHKIVKYRMIGQNGRTHDDKTQNERTQNDKMQGDKNPLQLIFP